MTDFFMVFDVESIGLHGEGFAVGWVIVNTAGEELDARFYACPHYKASGEEEGRAWVLENCPPLDQFGVNYWPPKFADGGLTTDPVWLRRLFWESWVHWKARGAMLAADCAWPVEARFLAACVDDQPEQRAWEGPYPLIDIASVRLAAGLDPLATVERLPSEMPAHDPLADARQSARLLIEALKVTRGCER
jgi:hypothetical protein